MSAEIIPLRPRRLAAFSTWPDDQLEQELANARLARQRAASASGDAVSELVALRNRIAVVMATVELAQAAHKVQIKMVESLEAELRRRGSL